MGRRTPAEREKTSGVFDRFATSRFIRLRELQPGFDQYLKPFEAIPRRDMADSLEDKPFRLRVDQDGFIEPSRIHQDPDIKYVFFGGSTTECAFVEEELRFPYLVGRKIEQSTGLKVNSFNSGVAAGNSMHSNFLFMAKALPMEPNFAIMMHNINDLVALLTEGSYWSNDQFRSIVIDKSSDETPWGRLSVAAREYFIPGISGWLAQKQPTTVVSKAVNHEAPKTRVREISSQFESSLRDFVRVAKANNVEPVLMTQMNRIVELPDKAIQNDILMDGFLKSHNMSWMDFKGHFDKFNAVVRHVAAAENVTLIDLDRDVPKTNEYMYDLVHLNSQGSALVADLIFEQLKGKIPAGSSRIPHQ